MIKFLIHRPVAVFMAFTAFFILGIITYLNIPVSLLPDIAIPEITVQASGKNMSARELENTVVAPIRQQLLQIGKMRDIHSETRDGSAIIRLSFDYGTNTDLAFIEVNEKIDAAMNRIPREIDRPRAIKASATDIPVFNLNLTLASPSALSKGEGTSSAPLRNDPAMTGNPNGLLRSARNDDAEFLDLCEFAETVIKRQIEQLPEVAMVDVTGLVNKQVIIQPDNNLLSITGITLSDIESALYNNNVEPGSMIVRDGYYEYNIKFSAVLRSIEDIRNIYIRKNGKIFQLKDIAKIDIVPEKEKGLALYNGKRAVVLEIIKQANENMSKMQTSVDRAIDNMKKNYPDIEFNQSQNQTTLLDYNISNLQQNLIYAFIFVLLVSIVFMRDIKSPSIIGLSMFVSLVISLTFFYLFKVSFNIVSLTGLILALGMMIDSSIIVTDNIGQYRQKGLSIDEACIKGTNEVIAPMLSSSFVNIVAFVPLIFLSGIAGAIFFDQAFSVTVGVLVAYSTGIILLPVLYKIAFSKQEKKVYREPSTHKSEKPSILEKMYDTGIEWVFSHKVLTIILSLSLISLSYFLFNIIRKEKMPDISQNELLVNIDWNENIHVDENNNRTIHFLSAIDSLTIENFALVAQQQFILNREKEQTSSETQIYLKTPEKKDIDNIKKTISDYFAKNYPDAIFTFSPVGTIFEKIFSTGDPDLVAEFYTRNRTEAPDAQTIRNLERDVAKATGETPTGLSFQKQLNLYIDREKLLLYKVSYDEVYQALRTGFKENEFSVLRSYQQYLPIVLGNEDRNVRDVIDRILIYTQPDENGQSNRVPLSEFVSIKPSEDLKTIVAGKNGEYIPMEFYSTDHVKNIIGKTKEITNKNSKWEVDFSGTFFSNQKMIGQLMIILIISILLMYFILAAQFESFAQPLLVLMELPINITAALAFLYFLGQSLNLMSAIGIVVSCGVLINDSILKVDIMNQLRKEGYPLMDAIHTAGRRRLKAILMTNLTAVVCMAPLLFSFSMGAELEKPLAITTMGGMIVGTLVSLFVVPMVYWRIYRNKELKIES